MSVNWDVIEGNWKQVKGKAKEEWGKLTDQELSEIEGRREKLAGKIQERYGVARAKAEEAIDDWAGRLKKSLK
jgi:uncharacterized protein YjbJ (UPF0337 family)